MPIDKDPHSMAAFAETLVELGKTFNAFKDVNDERLKALEMGDSPAMVELKVLLGRLELRLLKLEKRSA